MLRKNIVVAILLGLFTSLTSVTLHAQSPFSIYLQPLTITGLQGLHSYAYGKHNGKWLIIGGRIDGLHRRQPTTSFDVAGNNNRLIVVDPVAGLQWSTPLSGLSVALQEQLSSTNMEFHQQDSTLYCLGGYGYSATASDHITYSNIVAIDLAGVIDGVINSTPVAAFFRAQSDPEFAVTGGHLEKIDNTYYLIGGNKFDGRYNPMGGPSFTQVYTNQVRKFNMTDDGTTLTITHLTAYTDAANLHRRDYNAVPQIMPDGSEGVTAFSGVFQLTADVPFLNCVNIGSTAYVVNSTFSQYYNHYHCATLPVYSAAANEMHSVFFGGIAQYYDSSGVLVADNNVPFVKTIARVSRNSAGVMTEYKLPIEMPGLLGAGAELIPADGLPTYANDVLKLDELTADTTLAGYIFGGINSTAPNIFATNTGTQSTAYSQLLKVYIVKGAAAGTDILNSQSASPLKMQVYPNPNDGEVHISFHLQQQEAVVLTITNSVGAVVLQKNIENTVAGANLLSYPLKQISADGNYQITITTAHDKSTQKLVLHR
jgi:hypothetical protein